MRGWESDITFGMKKSMQFFGDIIANERQDILRFIRRISLSMMFWTLFSMKNITNFGESR